jgi:hypothetical protein
MANRGFPRKPHDAGQDDPSVYTKAYGAAAAGDDGKSYTSSSPARIPTQVVRLADSRTVELHVTWTPDTCWYQSYSRMGVDPLVHEALRQTMMQLVSQADRAATEKLGDVTDRWAECLGATEMDPGALLRSLDRIDPLRSPYGAATADCLTDEIRSEATAIRAEDHLRVAAANKAVLEQWVDILDSELEAARSTSG